MPVTYTSAEAFLAYMKQPSSTVGRQRSARQVSIELDQWPSPKADAVPSSTSMRMKIPECATPDPWVAFIQAIIAGVVLMIAGVPFAGVLAMIVLVLGIAQIPAPLVVLPVIGYIWAPATRES